tara:strand:+ start:2932 stop:3309 length:378 start_codon:yes stop_codon:yes gene_type:complete
VVIETKGDASTLPCEVCGKTVPVGQVGGLAVNPHEANRIREKNRKWRAENPGVTRVSDFPRYETAHWEWGHWKCQDDSTWYYIDSQRLQNPKQALGWTLHLMGKHWLLYTDWQAMMWKLGFAVHP